MRDVQNQTVIERAKEMALGELDIGHFLLLSQCRDSLAPFPALLPACHLLQFDGWPLEFVSRRRSQWHIQVSLLPFTTTPGSQSTGSAGTPRPGMLH